MIRTSDEWKLIHYPQIGKWQLFYLNKDSHELHNLVADGLEHSCFLRLRERLEAWRRTAGDPVSGK